MPVPKNTSAKLIFNGVHRAIRISQLPTHDVFFASKVRDTMEMAEGPDLAPDFWWEAVVVEVQSGAMARKRYIREWNARKLRQMADQKWEAVYEHVENKIGPLS